MALTDIVAKLSLDSTNFKAGIGVASKQLEGVTKSAEKTKGEMEKLKNLMKGGAFGIGLGLLKGVLDSVYNRVVEVNRNALESGKSFDEMGSGLSSIDASRIIQLKEGITDIFNLVLSGGGKVISILGKIGEWVGDIASKLMFGFSADSLPAEKTLAKLEKQAAKTVDKFRELYWSLKEIENANAFEKLTDNEKINALLEKQVKILNLIDFIGRENLEKTEEGIKLRIEEIKNLKAIEEIEKKINKEAGEMLEKQNQENDARQQSLVRLREAREALYLVGASEQKRIDFLREQIKLTAEQAALATAGSKEQIDLQTKQTQLASEYLDLKLQASRAGKESKSGPFAGVSDEDLRKISAVTKFTPNASLADADLAEGARQELAKRKQERSPEAIRKAILDRIKAASESANAYQPTEDEMISEAERLAGLTSEKKQLPTATPQEAAAQAAQQTQKMQLDNATMITELTALRVNSEKIIEKLGGIFVNQ